MTDTNDFLDWEDGKEISDEQIDELVEQGYEIMNLDESQPEED